MGLQLLALLAATLVCSEGVTVDIENGVYNLKKDTFDVAVKKFPAVMVYFHVPGCKECKELTPIIEKASKKLKKAAEASGLPDGGTRMAKVDMKEQPGLAAQHLGAEAGSLETALVVFKDGALFGIYQGGRDKDDLLGYMNAMTLPPPMDMLARAYFLSRCIYKDALRAVLPGAVRKVLFQAYPGVLAFPFVMMLLWRLCAGCCSDGRGAAAAAPEKAKEETDEATNDAKTEDTEKKDGSASGVRRRGGRADSPGRDVVAPKEKDGEEKDE